MAFDPITTIAGAAMGAVSAIPKLIPSLSEKQNKKALEELQRKQEMGMLGLTEAEKQALYNPATAQIAGRLREGGQIARQAGAAGMQTGAGTELLRQTQAFEQGAAQAANVSMNVQAQNLARQREMEGDLSARQAQDNQYKQDRINSLIGILTGTATAVTEGLLQKDTDSGAKMSTAEIAAVAKKLNITVDEAKNNLEYFGANPEAAPYASLLNKAGL